MPEHAHQLGKYHIIQELGKGGFGTVYRALDTTLEREVALKVLDPLLKQRQPPYLRHCVIHALLSRCVLPRCPQ